MNNYLVFFVIFCVLAPECRSQRFNFEEDPVEDCGARFSRLVDVRGSRTQRRDGEIIIADFKRDSFSCAENRRTLIKHANVRIDLQDPSGGFERNGKRWRNLQVQLNGPRPNGFPTSVANVLVQCDRSFPSRFMRRAFVNSMKNCTRVWLSQ